MLHVAVLVVTYTICSVSAAPTPKDQFQPDDVIAQATTLVAAVSPPPSPLHNLSMTDVMKLEFGVMTNLDIAHLVNNRMVSVVCMWYIKHSVLFISNCRNLVLE